MLCALHTKALFYKATYAFSKGIFHGTSIYVGISSTLSHKDYQLKRPVIFTEYSTIKSLCVDKLATGGRLSRKYGDLSVVVSNFKK